MTRYKDLLSRLFVIFIPLIFPCIAIYSFLRIISDNLKNMFHELFYKLFLENIKEIWEFSMIRNWFKTLYYALFDWSIGSINIPIKQAREQKIKEMKKRDFGDCE